MVFSGKKYITKHRNRFSNYLIKLINILILVTFLNCYSQNVPKKYRYYFKQYNLDQETYWDRILRLTNFKNDIVGRSYALVAGIDYYPNMLASSRYLTPAGEDIKKLVTYLKEEQNFDEIIVLKNTAVNPENLRYFLYQYLPEQIKGKKKTRFLFAYSGHGMTLSKRGYLLTSNARSLSDRKNSINLSTVKGYMDEIISVSHYNLALINSCYSGSFIYRKTFGDNFIPKGKGAHAITAGTSNQLTQAISKHGDGSIFFEKFLEGVKGKADYDGTGVVTVTEIYNHIHTEVSNITNQTQVPQLGDFSLQGSAGQFFFLLENKADKIARTFSSTNEQLKPKYFGKADKEKDEMDELIDDVVFLTNTQKLLTLANQGDVTAQSRLGKMFKNGFGVEKNDVIAVRWFRKAANQGDVISKYNLGLMYYHGYGVEQNYENALQFYLEAAEKGHANAQLNLGIMYYNGIGVIKDYKQAVNWYHKAAKQQQARSQRNLGLMYQRGLGVEKNYKKAIFWYRKAAEQDECLAQYHLGNLYSKGLGVEKDLYQAVFWWKKACKQNCYTACKEL